MKRAQLFSVLAASALAAGLTASSVAQTSADPSIRRFVEVGRKVSGQIIQQIGSEMRKEVELSGPMRAVIVCKFTAPEVTSNLSRINGMRISRVSLRPRNPSLGYPDAWEQKVLLDFERRAAAGERVDTLEHVERVKEPAGEFLRFMKAIPTAKVCLACHGPYEQLSEPVKAQLAHEYPHDRGVGSTEGSVRGAVTVKQPL